jgi:hypothetical protein
MWAEIALRNRTTTANMNCVKNQTFKQFFVNNYPDRSSCFLPLQIQF